MGLKLLRRVWLLAAMTALFVTSVYIVASPANAEIPTCGAQSPYNYHTGYIVSPNTGTAWEGAGVDITNQYGAVCDTDHSAPNPSLSGHHALGSNFTTAYSMIAANDSCGWVQTGIIRGYGSPQYIWAEEAYCDASGNLHWADYFPASPTIANGTTYDYKNIYVSSCGCEEAIVANTTVVLATWFDPYGTWSGGSDGLHFDPQYDGETTYKESDIMGVPSSHTSFAGLGVQRSADDATQGLPCGYLGTEGNDNPTRWTHSVVTPCKAFDIWTAHTS